MAWIIIGVVFLAFLLKFHFKRQEKRNRYIEEHQKHLKNDHQYDNYLKWCERAGEVPMDKKIFNKEIEGRNNKVKNLFK